MKYIRKFENNSDYYQSKYKELMSLPYNDFVEYLKKWIKTPKIQEILNSGKKDKSIKDEIINFTEVEIPVRNLKPTQKEIELSSIFKSIPKDENFERLIDGDMDYFKRNKLFIANNKFILDGHHRWALIYSLNPESKIPCININVPETDPDKILRIVQLAIAATYDDIYIKDKEIENNLFELNKEKIKKELPNVVPNEIIKQVSKSYSKLEMIKNLINTLTYLSQFSSSENEDKLNENFTEVDKEEEGLTIGDGLSLAADLVGILDPTGSVDVANGLRYLNNGEYFYALCSFISAVPYIGDAIGKPIIFAAKSGKVGKVLLKSFSKALETFDYVKLSALAKKMGKPFEKFVEKSKEWLPKLLNKMSKWLDKLGDKYPKLKRFYTVLKNSTKMWEKCNEWLKKLKGIIKSFTESDAIEILSMNLNELIEENKKFVNNLDIKSKYTPNPIEISKIKGYKPTKKSEFKGVPIELLDKLKSGDINFKPSKKIKKYETFKKV